VNYDPTDIRAQERDRMLAEQRRRAQEKAEADDVRWLMGTKRGRRIIWRLLERAGVFRVSFHTNSMTMAFNEGMRNEGLRLMALINADCPDLYLQMVRESNERLPNDPGRDSQSQRERDPGTD